MRSLTRTAAGLTDLGVVVALLTIVMVTVTGGGAVTVGPLRISARSPGNALVALATLLILRALTLRWGPLLGWWPAEAVEARAVALISRFSAWSATVRVSTAGRIVVVISLAALLLKIGFAAADPGFFSGDDVEIHEMTLGYLLRQPWPVWDLRSPVFPFAFVLPAQWLRSHLGNSDIESLVLAGRCSVALVSTLAVWLTYRIASQDERSGLGYAVLAALLLASSKLHIAYGSSELPRPVAAVFVLGGFALLATPTHARALMAAGLLGAAASLRFSEAIFFLPAAVQLVVQRRYAAALIVAAVASLVFALIVGWADARYWGQPFHSLLAASDYTLVRQLSSRGVQAPWWYLSAAARWTTLPLMAFAVWGAARDRRAALWLLLPLLALSVLPHKEERYAIPVVPFLCLLAAQGVRRLIEEGSRRWAAGQLAPAIVAALLGNLLLSGSGWRLARSNTAVAAAPTLARSCGGQAPIAVEQLWRMGGRLYFGARSAADLDPSLVAQRDYLAGYLDTYGCIALDSRTLQRHPELGEQLEGRSFSRVRLGEDAGYHAWESAPAAATPGNPAGR